MGVTQLARCSYDSGKQHWLMCRQQLWRKKESCRRKC